MNYAQMLTRLEKLQSDEHPTLVYTHKGASVKTYFPWDDIGYTWGYTIPNSAGQIDPAKCKPLERMPFHPCPVDEMLEIIPMQEVANGKRKLILFETRFGQPTYVAKRLRQYFPAQARFFQGEHLGTITVALERATKFDIELVPVGYICPHRAPHQSKDSK